MSEYRDDRAALLERVTELEEALARAERRGESHVVEALRSGDLALENDKLRAELRKLRERQLIDPRPWLTAAAITIVVLLAIIGALVMQH